MVVVVLAVGVEADAGAVQCPQDLGVAAEQAHDEQRQDADDDGEQEDDGAHETLPKVRTAGAACSPRSSRPMSAVRAGARRSSEAPMPSSTR